MDKVSLVFENITMWRVWMYFCDTGTFKANSKLTSFKQSLCRSYSILKTEIINISMWQNLVWGKLYYAKMHFINHTIQLLAAVSIKI